MKINWFTKGKINAGTTVRDAALPEGGNTALHVCIDEEAVMANRIELAKETLPLSRWALPWQKHTDHFAEVTQNDAGRGATDKDTSILETDAVYTSVSNVLVGVFTADCCGIVVAEETAPLIACIHSGWKGTAQAITYKTVRHLIDEKRIDPVHAEVWFSPCLLQSSLEVGMEVIEQMEGLRELGISVDDYWYPTLPDKAQLDNMGLNIAMLELLGIPSANIHPTSVDTKTTASCFSYRRDGKGCGEHFTFAWIDE